jgi:hypothetical protein
MQLSDDQYKTARLSVIVNAIGFGWYAKEGDTEVDVDAPTLAKLTRVGERVMRQLDEYDARIAEKTQSTLEYSIGDIVTPVYTPDVISHWYIKGVRMCDGANVANDVIMQTDTPAKLCDECERRFNLVPTAAELVKVRSL